MMPRLGDPIEPSQPRALETWWRGVDEAEVASPEPEEEPILEEPID